MKQSVLFVCLLVILFSCKKSNDPTSTNYVSIQLQGQASENIGMNKMYASLSNAGCPSLFADSCQFPYIGSGTYLLIGDYSMTSSGSNPGMVIDIQRAGLFRDTSIHYLAYTLLNPNDSINIVGDTAGRNPFYLGAQFLYTDANGVKWDSETNTHVQGQYFSISSRTALSTTSSNTYYTTISGSFSCTVFNSSGASKSLTGSFSNLVIQLPD